MNNLNQKIIESHKEYKDILYKHAIEIYKDAIDNTETYGEAFKKVEDLKFKVKRVPELADLSTIYELALVILEQRIRATSIKK